MTRQILKSAIDAAGLHDFPALAAAHALEMQDWRAHAARVLADEKNGVTGIEKHWPHPMPSSHTLVESAVNEKDEPDFEIVDDGPTPEQRLEARKYELMQEVAHAERAAIEAIVPPGKHRVLNLRESAIRAADVTRVAGLLEKSVEKPGFTAAFTASLKRLVSRAPPAVDIPAEIIKRRPPEDAAFLAEQDARREKLEIIFRAAAHMHSDIHDLTAETVDSWKRPDFKI